MRVHVRTEHHDLRRLANDVAGDDTRFAQLDYDIYIQIDERRHVVVPFGSVNPVLQLLACRLGEHQVRD